MIYIGDINLDLLDILWEFEFHEIYIYIKKTKNNNNK